MNMHQHERDFEFELQELDLQKRTIVGTITTASVDRYREIVDPSGILLDNYRKNPVVLLNHGRSYDLPIGRNQWIKQSKKGLVASTEFTDSPIALDVLKLYDGGYMKGWSIGFMGRKWEDADATKSGGYWRKWTETELIEYSAVTVPANPDAVSNMLDLCEAQYMRDLLERESRSELLLRQGELTETRISEVIERLARTEELVRALEQRLGEKELIDRILSAPVEEPREEHSHEDHPGEEHPGEERAQENAEAPADPGIESPRKSGLEMPVSFEARVRRRLLAEVSGRTV